MILVFDVGDTLVYKEPTQDKVIADRFMQVGISLTEQEARCMHQITELRIAEQIWRENQGAPRMEDQEFFHYIDQSMLNVPWVANRLTNVNAEKFFMTQSLMHQKKIVHPETYSVLRALQQNHRMGIISNYTADLMDFLQEIALAGYFETIVISEMVGCEKPDAKIYSVFCEQMNCCPDECVYIGDHPFDILGAKQAGMKAIWLNHIYDAMPDYISERADATANNLYDIVNICKTHDW